MYKKKKCFPCKHGNPPCCLLLLYLKKHVVQLSTSVKTIRFVPFFCFWNFSYLTKFPSTSLVSPRKLKPLTRSIHTDFIPRELQFFTRILYFTLWSHALISYTITVKTVEMIIFFFFLSFIWCHFVYLECFWKKREKNYIKKKILEWMQICNCAFLYQLVWLKMLVWNGA